MTDAELRALAEAATPGLWEVDRDDDEGGRAIFIPTVQPRSSRIRWNNSIYSDRPVADAAYIAAASPDRILVLLDRIAALEEVADRLGELRETSAIEGNEMWTAGSRAAFGLAEAKVRAALAREEASR